MQVILKSIGMYIIKQEWFQFAVVKMVTKTLEMAQAGAAVTNTGLDDALISFIQRNKDELLSVVGREANFSNTPIDGLLKTAIQNLK